MRKKAVLVEGRQTSIFEVDDVYKPTNWIEALMIAGLTIEGGMKFVSDDTKRRRLSSLTQTKKAEWISDFLVSDSVKVFRAGFVKTMGNFGFGKVKAPKLVRVPRRKHSYNMGQAYLEFAVGMVNKIRKARKHA